MSMRRIREIRIFTALIVCLVAVIFSGCSSGESENAEAPENFEFLQEGEGSSGSTCFEECDTYVIDMCDMVENGHALTFVQVDIVDRQSRECEEWPYASNHMNAQIDVLEVAAGDEAAANVEDLLAWSTRDLEEGGMYVMLMREIEGEWWGHRVYEIVPEQEGAEIADAEKEDEDVDITFDVPSNQDEFIGEAQNAWNDYGETCDTHEPRMGMSEEELLEAYYDKRDCSSSGYDDETPDGEGDVSPEDDPDGTDEGG